MTWRGAAAAGTAVGAVYLTARSPLVREAAWLLFVAGAASAVPAGIRRHRPDAQGAWWLVTAGFAFVLLSSVLRYPLWTTPSLASASELTMVGAYVAMGLAAVAFVRHQSPGDREWAIDATIVMVAVATVLSGTMLGALGAALTGGLLALTGPILLSGVIAAALRLLFAGGMRVMSAWLFTAAAVSMAAGNALRVIVSAHGLYERGTLTDVWIVVAYVCAAAAALHPSMPRLTAPAEPGEMQLTYPRLTVLGAALLAAPATLVMLDGASVRRLPVLSSVALSLLVVWRLGRLVLEREEVRSELQASAARHEALARIGLHALDELELDTLFEEATQISAGLLDLDTCRVVASGSVEASGPGAVALRVGGLGHAHGALVVSRVAPWNDEDLAFLQSVANVLAGAVERHETQSAMRYQALHDPLTGLPNRTLLRDRLHTALARARRGGRVAVMFVDLDGFKRVNDDLGHQAGDELLVAAARRLHGVIRPYDTLGRLSGDEFVIVCADIERALSEQVPARLAAALAEPFALRVGTVSITASIGIAVSGRDWPGTFTGGSSEEVDRLLSDADTAMYRAKRGGGAGFQLFDGDWYDRLEARWPVETS